MRQVAKSLLLEELTLPCNVIEVLIPGIKELYIPLKKLGVIGI